MTIEDHIMSKIIPIVDEKIEERLESIRYDMARKFVNTRVSGSELRSILGWSNSYVYQKRKRGELPYDMVNGSYVYDIRVILDRIDELNFRNIEGVRSRIRNWIDEQVQIKLRN